MTHLFQMRRVFQMTICMYSRSHLGWHFRMLFQSSKLKASMSFFIHWNVTKETFELWALSFRKGRPKWDWLQWHLFQMCFRNVSWPICFRCVVSFRWLYVCNDICFRCVLDMCHDRSVSDDYMYVMTYVLVVFQKCFRCVSDMFHDICFRCVVSFRWLYICNGICFRCVSIMCHDIYFKYVVCFKVIWNMYGWLSLKLKVSFAEYRLFYRVLWQKRPIILRSLRRSLVVATPYELSETCMFQMARSYVWCDSLMCVNMPHST